MACPFCQLRLHNVKLGSCGPCSFLADITRALVEERWRAAIRYAVRAEEWRLRIGGTDPARLDATTALRMRGMY